MEKFLAITTSRKDVMKMRRIFASVAMVLVVAFGAAACGDDVPLPITERTVTVVSKELVGRCNCIEKVYVKSTNSDGSLEGTALYPQNGNYALIEVGKTYLIETQEDDYYDQINLIGVIREVGSEG